MGATEAEGWCEVRSPGFLSESVCSWKCDCLKEQSELCISGITCVRQREASLSSIYPPGDVMRLPPYSAGRDPGPIQWHRPLKASKILMPEAFDTNRKSIDEFLQPSHTLLRKALTVSSSCLWQPCFDSESPAGNTTYSSS